MKSRGAFLGLALIGLLLGAALVLGATPALRWQIVGSGGGPVQGPSNGLAAAIGQPVSGAVSGGGYMIYNGLYLGAAAPGPGGGTTVMLPSVLSNYCVGLRPAREKEPNDLAAAANGPLCPGVIYQGSPDDHGASKDDDWYYFEWSGKGTITIEVTGFLAVGQLLLYRDPAAAFLARDYDRSNGQYSVGYTGSGQAGIYYIRVFAPDGHPTGNGEYSLTYR